jgi:hypothetical protein
LGDQGVGAGAADAGLSRDDLLASGASPCVAGACQECERNRPCNRLYLAPQGGSHCRGPERDARGTRADGLASRLRARPIRTSRRFSRTLDINLFLLEK